MEGKNVTRIKLLTVLLILTILLIIVMAYFIYKFYNENITEKEKVLDLKSQVSNLEEKINTIPNTINENIENNKEIIKVDSSYGKSISTYLENIWIISDIYKDCIAEFQDIKNAPKEYLAICAALGVMRETNSDNIYTAKIEFSEFNNKLVQLFGENANGLLNESDIEKVPFVEKNSDNTYHFFGFDGSEINNTLYSIKNIEKENNLFYVDLYEYKIKSDKALIELTAGEEINEYAYDRNDNLILKTTIKAIQDGNITYYKCYDEKGNEFDSTEDLLLEKYKDKLSVRQIKLEYIEDTNSFIMINNKLNK